MNEDFVSFDLAKKLKEKGFPQYTEKSYFVGDHKKRMCSVGTFLHVHTQNTEHLIAAPTIAQVLKWLRDCNAIHIHICLYSKGWYCDVYTFEYYEEDKEYGVKHNVQFDEFSTYEEAALAGIEYALDIVI